MIDRRSVLIALAGAGLVPSLGRALEIVIAGSVVSVTGPSTGELDGKTRELQTGGPIFLADLLGTGDNARLGVKLGEATRLSLGALTRIRIDSFLINRGGELVLETGNMMFERPEEPASGPLEVITPFGLIVARGTKFFAGAIDGTFGIFVEHGRVDVTNPGGTVSLTAGLGTSLTSKTRTAAPPIPAEWSIEKIARAQASVL